MNLYRKVLEDVEALRSREREIRSGRRLARQTRFVQSIERDRWQRLRRAVVPIKAANDAEH